MKDDVILKVENLSKQYRLGTVGTGTISHDLNRWWAKIRGKEDPYLRVGDANDRSSKASSEYVWALKDINFDVKRGEVLGIIGKNGAGKSTLLKILSKVTGPTTGSIKSKGRIASLLEVGTGFHPEMTGRENIFLNGAILGMTKKEIASKLDEIIDFSGCERYVDTPVKRYSSGMKVRLAFAVAAHLEPDILVVDEVLAVGDAEFQKKAIGKMQDISKGEGRTVLFVSHDMAAVKRLCNKCILLNNGKVSKIGSTSEIIDDYLFVDKPPVFIKTKDELFKMKKTDLYFKSVRVFDDKNKTKETYVCSENINIEVEIGVNSKVMNSSLFIMVMKNNESRIFSAEKLIEDDKYIYKLRIDKLFLTKGNYILDVYLHIPNTKRYDTLSSICSFDVIDDISPFIVHGGFNHGAVFGNYTWV
ncbi:ABC transporter ATP-binding protein [Tenacibaculum aquimarinum]|uniref:ABC transporter ATP-binding protein n=1 Tax=Tenacibaculum aquimarinum TaxID=2910675 RepID=UPI001F0A264C|nr:ABC transporter ATP-binding protein [Tenacibaculum aquimarinum]MCH3881937.1 ABC transporter ATP-binding protein [Tenacibaculum aquimarinum]